MTIHLFGAYFGVICAFFFNGRRAIRDDERRGMGGYTSNTIAAIGTCFLFIYFPSFNAAMLEGAGIAATTGLDFDRGRGGRFLRFSYCGREADMAAAPERLARWLGR